MLRQMDLRTFWGCLAEEHHLETCTPDRFLSNWHMLVGGSHTILALNNHSRRFVFTRLSDALWGEKTDLDSSISTPIARLEHGGNRCQLLRHELVSKKTMCPINSLTMVTDEIHGHCVERRRYRGPTPHRYNRSLYLTAGHPCYLYGVSPLSVLASDSTAQPANSR